MDRYELNYTIPSPVTSPVFMEFSPNGRILAVGDRGLSLLYILDKLAGFHPKISAVMLAEPTALVWETAETFYVGLSDGYFVHFRINFKDDGLVEGFVNGSLRDEGFPVTAVALDAESRTLVMSVGPSVFAFRRIRATSKFRMLNHGCKLTRLEANSASLPVFQPASISREIREPQPRHFRGLFALLPTMCLSSHSVGNISREVDDRTPKVRPHSCYQVYRSQVRQQFAPAFLFSDGQNVRDVFLILGLLM